MVRFLPLTVLLIALPVAAGDCPTPKPLNCERLKQIAANKNCPVETKEVPVAVNIPCPPAAPKPEPEVRVVTEYIPVLQDVPRETVRPLVGGGIAYFHGVGYELHAGAMFPKDKWGHNWTFKIGPTWIPQNDTADINGTCAIGCKTCKFTVPGQPADKPLGVIASFDIVF